MRVLQIDEAARKEIQKVIDYANKNKFTITDLKRIINDSSEAAGYNPEFVAHIHDGYRVVYSLEEQPIGWCHHISISVETKDMFPHEAAVEEILSEFGMDRNFKSGNNMTVWIEEEAVNILQKVV